MADFPRILKQCIDSSGFTIYQLAQISGVNRTTIQKALTAGRIPQKEAFLKIVSALSLTRAEHKMLMESYEFITDGEYRFRQRRYIKDFLENTVSSAFLPSAAKVFYDNSIQVSQFPAGRQLLSGAQIDDTLRLLLFDEIRSREKSAVSLFLPMEQPDILKGFFSSLKDSKKITVTQLLYLIRNPAAVEKNSLHNLEVFSHILPTLLTTSSNYHIYYSYNDFIPVPEVTTGFPYYAIFSGCLMLFSPDLKTAWLEDDPKLLGYLQKRFLSIIGQSRELNTQIQDAAGYLEKTTMLYANASFSYSIEYQPCLIPYVDNELADALINPLLPWREQLKELLGINRFQFHSLKKNIILFAENGLKDFIQCGRINVPEEYARACTPGERALLLHRIEEACAEEHVIMRCINPALFNIEKQLYLSLQQNGKISFFSYNMEPDEFRYTEFEEYTIYAAFCDFIEFILDSEYVFSLQETLEIIRAGIQELSS